MNASAKQDTEVPVRKILSIILLRTLPVAAIVVYGCRAMRSLLSESGYDISRSVYSVILVLLLIGVLQLTAGKMLTAVFPERLRSKDSRNKR